MEREIKLPCGTLYKIINEIPDYRGTRRSLGKWLRRMDATTVTPERPKKKKRPVKKKPSLPKSDSEKIEKQLRRELDEALRKVACLESLQKKDAIRREFLEEQIASTFTLDCFLKFCRFLGSKNKSNALYLCVCERFISETSFCYEIFKVEEHQACFIILV